MTSGYRVICYRVIGFGLAIAGASSCGLTKATEPALTGPSMYGVSLALSASPDLLPRDGWAQSVVTISAYDASQRPVANLRVHLDLQVENIPGGLGTLSQRDIVTGSDGRATAIYTAPMRAPDGQSDDATVQVVVTPVGTDAGNTTSSMLKILLKSQGEAGGPTASFVYSPTAPHPLDKILFDARASSPSTGASIVGWQWDFGDGNNTPLVPYLSGAVPTFTHDYLKPGQYTVVLTVLDSNNRRATATKILTVSD